uniref:Uncharacterized protein n=1 Tax=Arundo donax TaxID=35708 RepID=A0A0A9HC47_ARUDO
MEHNTNILRSKHQEGHAFSAIFHMWILMTQYYGMVFATL